MKSDPKLRRWFLHFNRIHFSGELPLDTVLYWEPLGKVAADTGLNNGRFVLRFDPMMHGLFRHVKADMNHEMAHIKLWHKRRAKDHGRLFDAEIQRLCTFRSYRKLL